MINVFKILPPSVRFGFRLPQQCHKTLSKTKTKYYKVLQSITKYNKVWQSMTKYDKVWQSITKYYKALQRPNLIRTVFNGIREAIPEKNILSFGHCWNNNPRPPLACIFRHSFTFSRWENVVSLHYCLKLNANDNFDCRNWNSSSRDENMWPCFSES